MDATDRRILASLIADGRRSFEAIGREVSLSAPSVKRRVDRLRGAGTIRGFTTVVDYSELGSSTEALIELFFAPGVPLAEVAVVLERFPEVIEAWSVTGEPDAIARVRTVDNSDLERLIIALQREAEVVRTRSQVVLSQLVTRAQPLS
jgi:Lrp/AsnC family leucine-responsive transcriptional regulator